MAVESLLQRRVRPQKQEIEDDAVESEGFDSANDIEEAESGSEEGSDDGEGSGSQSEVQSQDEEDEDDNSEVPTWLESCDIISNTPKASSALSETLNPLANISFGALASAQESLGSKRKRTGPTSLLPSKRQRSLSPFAEAAERKAGKKAAQPDHRSSKHAPTELSSKKAVSRKRTVVAVPTVQARDPRFSAVSGFVDTEKIKNKYAFLNDYRASEIAELKTQMRAAKDDAAKEELKQQIRRMEDRERARLREDEKQAVVREHRKKEREMIGQGKKPYYLKEGEVKKAVLVKRFEGMSERKVERVIEKRRKKKTGKERRNMPFGRRVVEEG
jgi:ribosomal RNA-processing protein 36